MKLLGALAALAVLCACSQPAELQADTAAIVYPATGPEMTIGEIYEPYISGQTGQDLTPYLSAELAPLWTAAWAVEGGLGFDPVIAGQDWSFTNVNVDVAEAPTDGRSVVKANFADGVGGTIELIYDMVLENGAWKIDNIRKEGANAYDLRTLIATNTAQP
jgi:hypothetical protein